MSLNPPALSRARRALPRLLTVTTAIALTAAPAAARTDATGGPVAPPLASAQTPAGPPIAVPAPAPVPKPPATTTPAPVPKPPAPAPLPEVPDIPDVPAPESLSPQATTPTAPRPAAGWNGFGANHWPPATWRPYADTSPFNRQSITVPVHPNSAALVQRSLQWGMPGSLVTSADSSRDFGHPTYYSQPTDPLYTLRSASGRTAIDGQQIRIPAKARQAGGADGHMTVVTPLGWEYDFWQVTSKPAGGGVMTFSNGGRTRIDGDGLNSYGTAALYGNLAGMIRAPELIAGRINHALFIVLKCTSSTTSFGYGTTKNSTSNGAFVYPAMHGGSSCADPNVPPMGARFRLAMTDAQIAALAVPVWKKTILRALAQYGGYVGDTGGPGFAFMFESSTTYTAFGVQDPLVPFAAANRVTLWQGDYVFRLAEGVDWARYLRVIAPPTR